MKLKPLKCVPVLLSILANDPGIKMIGEWLGDNCLGWELMELTNKATCLGIFLGPFAGTCQWPKAVEKFQARVATIRSLHLPPALARIQFASRVLLVLAYIA